jgi:hypothetical protein
MRTRRSLTAAFAVPLIFGIISLTQLMGRPRFATYNRPDVLQLFGTGMCFGVALVALIALLRGPRDS